MSECCDREDFWTCVCPSRLPGLWFAASLQPGLGWGETPPPALAPVGDPNLGGSQVGVQAVTWNCTVREGPQLCLSHRQREIFIRVLKIERWSHTPSPYPSPPWDELTANPTQASGNLVLSLTEIIYLPFLLEARRDSVAAKAG